MFSRSRPPHLSSYALIASCSLAISTALADEGMWLYNAQPAKQLKEKYQFEPTQAWLDHLQKASVRFNSGGSGSVVSAEGLVITNHHVGADALQKSAIRSTITCATAFMPKTALRKRNASISNSTC